MIKIFAAVIALLAMSSLANAQEKPWKGPSEDFSHGKLKVSDNKRFLVL